MRSRTCSSLSPSRPLPVALDGSRVKRGGGRVSLLLTRFFAHSRGESKPPLSLSTWNKSTSRASGGEEEKRGGGGGGDKVAGGESGSRRSRVERGGGGRERRRSKGNEGFPEHSTHFSLPPRPTTQTSRLSTPLVETKSDTRKAKLLQMHKPPPLIPPLLVPGHSLPLSLSLSLARPRRLAPFSPTLTANPSHRENVVLQFTLSFLPPSRVFQLSSLFDSPSCPLGFFAPLRPSAVCPESWFHGYRISILGKPTRDPSTSDCLTPLINLVESLGEDFGCSFPPFPARTWHATRARFDRGRDSPPIRWNTFHPSSRLFRVEHVSGARAFRKCFHFKRF